MLETKKIFFMIKVYGKLLRTIERLRISFFE